MKAVKYTKYGGPEVLRFTDVEKPVPGPEEVLIRIHETLVTASDIPGREGDPFLVRFFSGLLRPKAIPGSDLAGRIEAVGEQVQRFKVGDRVFGAVSPGTGTHAEYICVPEKAVLATIPDGMRDEETAGICDAAMTALTFLRDVADVRPGQKVLINGASGAIGTFAVQLAKHFGAEVTGVCSGPNAELVRSLGADRVIDYTRDDFTQNGQAYDVIFDAVGKRTFLQCRDSLTPGGKYLTTVPSIGILWHMLRTARSGGRKAVFSATGLQQTVEKLETLKGMLAAGQLRSVVGRRFPFEQIAEAHRYVESGHKIGNVVITLAD